MRIIQITDFHLSASADLSLGQDTQEKILALLCELETISFDILVLTGDFCFEKPDPRVYIWLKTQLEKTTIDCPMYFIPGNHDNTQMLTDSFSLNSYLVDGELYYSIRREGRTLIFLDTSRGEMSQKQKDWLSEILSGPEIDRAPIIFMHHPPMLSGVLHMDRNYMLRDREEFMKICKASGNSIFIFCGHYHTEKTVVSGTVCSFITPSCYVQIAHEPEVFEVDHFKSAYRLIEIDSSDKLMTSVHYQGMMKED